MEADHNSYDGATLEPLAWPVPWGSGQPEATVLAWGLGVVLVHPARDPSCWGVVQFVRPQSVRYGSPNLEIAEAHPLGRKAKPGTLYVVHASPWRRDVESINATHSQYDESYWSSVRHYFAFLWDYTFECLASDVRGELLEMDFNRVLVHAVSQINVVRQR